ncbi:MAG: right-handed parallel beta-helix repeat-containing protein [Bryobacterales bacterium]|nr:right-handed parallel beta-helix repeat-containing protein [Bryobacterales bacterium]
MTAAALAVYLWAGQLQAPTSGTLQLPAGVVELERELAPPAGATRLTIEGAPEGTLLRAGRGFRGRALLVLAGARQVTVRRVTFDGQRELHARPQGLPPSNVPFFEFTANNGVLVLDSECVRIEEVRFERIPGFAVLAARSRNVRIERIEVRDSGSLDERGRNNTTGGVLFEEGTVQFTVRASRFLRIRGNGVWTHSLYTSPRNSDGVIEENDFEELARDAIQVGHATRVRVVRNRGRRIGYPVAEVDPEATPVALDTAGDTDRCVYAWNRFEEVNGKCIDLDGFHDGEVRGNSCVNRGRRGDYPHGHFGIVLNDANPDMRSENIVIAGNRIEGFVFGGLFLIGRKHRVTGNAFVRLNLARCQPGKPGCVYWPDQPELLSSGIYLGRGVSRHSPAEDNLITGNTIRGFGMSRRCIVAAPGVQRAKNRIAANHCADR